MGKEFYHTSEAGRVGGRYRVVTVYWYDGEIYESPSVNGFDDIGMARQERDDVLREGILDDEHGKIPISDLISVEIRERVVQYRRVAGEA